MKRCALESMNGTASSRQKFDSFQISFVVFESFELQFLIQNRTCPFLLCDVKQAASLISNFFIQTAFYIFFIRFY